MGRRHRRTERIRKTTFADDLAASLTGAAIVHNDDLAWREPLFTWGHQPREGVLDSAHAGNRVTFVPANTNLPIVGSVGSSQAAVADLADVTIWVHAEARRRGLAGDIATGISGAEAETIAFWDEWDAAEVAFLARDCPWDRRRPDHHRHPTYADRSTRDPGCMTDRRQYRHGNLFNVLPMSMSRSSSRDTYRDRTRSSRGAETPSVANACRFLVTPRTFEVRYATKRSRMCDNETKMVQAAHRIGRHVAGRSESEMTFQPYVQAPIPYRLRRNRRASGDRAVMVCVLCGTAIVIAAVALMGILTLMYPGA